MANPVNKALLLKYLDHQCTPEEQQQVAAWLQLPGSSDVLDALLTARLDADMEESSDVEAAQKALWLNEMHARMGAPVTKVKRMRVWKQAAVWAAVLIGAGSFTIYQLQQRPVSATLAMVAKQNPAGQRATIQLTDGSVVHLGAGSSLQYPEAFKSATRDVFLDGEAFFEIAENSEKPFVVHTGDIQTTVLGTSFKISAFGGVPLSVAVATGKVRVDHKQGNTLTQLAVLTPGRQVTWEPAGNHTELAKVEVADVEGWKRGRLVFNNKTLQEVALDLERWYDVKISFGTTRKASEKITVTLFGSAGLERNLQLLAAGSNFKYTVNDRNIIIH
ncbi:FecR family protein [uncultured Chitinophaga sp.]|uniref:FecR family protein n=1 Tax=uncultured Chitinophaga sp. TaxID=339340 RepID=UPI0025F4B535|nr:FecR domain-containing protein [uncultured Chitinophaga sp.]